MNTRKFDFVFKVVIIGDSFVGKTTMLQNYIGNKEVGVQCHLAEKDFHRNGHRVKLQIYDTMGQERYRSLTTSYYRGANGCLVCFDKKTTKSFENIQTFWLSDMVECIGKDTPKILVGISKKNRDSDGINQDIAQSEIISMSAQYRMPYMDVLYGFTDCKEDLDAVFGALTDLIVTSLRDYVPRNGDPDIVSLEQSRRNASCKC